MKSLLLLTDIFPPDIGGPATFIDALAHAATAQQIQVSVVCLTDQRREATDKTRPFRVLRLMRYERRTFKILGRLIEEEMREHEAILVNGLELISADAARKAGKKFLLKIVGDYIWENARNNLLAHCSIDEFQQISSRPEWLAQAMLNRQFYLHQAEHIVVPSRYLARLVGNWGVSPSNISVIYNGIDQDSFASCEPRPRGTEPFTVGFCGRLVNWKGVDTLLGAVRELPDIRLKICGDGPEKGNLEALACTYGLTDRVMFTGPLAKPQLRKALGSCHALVLDSQYEGLSHTLLEAAAMGLARIASDCCGNPEVVTHGKDGLLVPFGDSSALAQTLRCLAKDDDLRLNLARESMLTATRFSFADTVSQTLDLLKARQTPLSGTHGGRSSVCCFGGLFYHASAAEQVAVGEVFHETKYDFLKALHLPDIPTIIDMGANTGLFSLYCFRLYPKAKIAAFEPCRETFALLATNQSLNDMYDWQVEALGGWSNDTTIRFMSAKPSTAGRIDPDFGNEEVNVIGLQTLLSAYATEGLDLLKVDIEGSEEALLCQEPELLKNIRHVIVELHSARCNTAQVERVLHAQFPHVYAIEGRRSSKPLLLASRDEYPLTRHLPSWNGSQTGRATNSQPESTAPMRITHVINLGEYPGLAPFSGAENHLFELMKALCGRGHVVEFAPIVYRDGPSLHSRFHELETSGIRVFPLRCEGMHGVAGDRQAIELLRNFFATRTSHIIHTHLDPADYLARIAARLAGCTMVMSSVHNNEPHYEQPDWRRQLQVLDHLNEKYIAISSVVRDCLLNIGVPRDKIETIPYGLTPPTSVTSRQAARDRLGLDHEAFIVGFVGRLEPQKNLPLLFAAMRLLPDMDCVLVGGGSLRSDLEALAAQMGLGNIHFAGYMPDAADIMPAFDVLCLPSLWEGLGLVLVEAMLRNVPVLGSRAGAIPDVLDNGEAGILFSQDSLQELVTSLKFIRSKKNLMSRLAEKARRYALERFSLSKMIERTETVYINLLHK